ncbi:MULTISPECIES: glycoside hydrolase family 13 protein [Cryobacterium]|uniref:glycoside hydrolase family 13 protein n=1 Tax=Cryobacterium TaxID=69578 RepID=UPI000CD3D0E2|nr:MULTISPECIES: glycoside hydrolase family 13 protein [Cryobacterium]POH64514.1 alpha-amylase [Cryobacterium zongtaii]TFC47440.1 alpha-amylase [Cryobacterium sp. TMN-39-2]
MQSNWWHSAVIYQVYPRSFADTDGDGVGDLPGITAHLDDLVDLGVDAVWVSPFFTSPQRDAGYDVADYCDVDPVFGTLDDADALIHAAHERGIRLIVDLVPNHSSSDHPWFQEALRAAPGSAARARYVFRDGRGEHGEFPPNNWQSVFGGPMWTRTAEADGTPGQWYLHIFDSSQPDFDWTNPEVRDLFLGVLRFWLDRGVDGFRVDVAHGLMKEPGLPDVAEPEAVAFGAGPATLEPAVSAPVQVPYWGQDTVHEIYREWRALLESYPGERILIAEAWVDPLPRLADWVRPDEMHQAFNFAYLETPWAARPLREIIDASLATFGSVGAPSTWVLSNHDVVRHATRLALTFDNPQGHGIGLATPNLPEPASALQRARAATALMLALPGSAYLYQGEELGLPEAIELPDHARQDPTWFRSDNQRYGRDGCRVPLPWTAHGATYGFSASKHSWLPQPERWRDLARDLQRVSDDSTLSLYRHLLAVRKDLQLGSGTVRWLDSPRPDVLVFQNGLAVIIANTGDLPITLPEGDILACSAPVEDATLPEHATAWLRLSNTVSLPLP